jgi:hypothetical protein
MPVINHEHGVIKQFIGVTFWRDIQMSNIGIAGCMTPYGTTSTLIQFRGSLMD